MPGRLSPAGRVIKPRVFMGLGVLDEGVSRMRQGGDGGRCAVLVGYDAHGACCGETLYRGEKVAPFTIIEPGSAEDEARNGARKHGFFASALGESIDAQGVCWVIFRIRCSVFAIEHVVRGVVNEPHVMTQGEIGHKGGRVCVDTKGGFLIVFRVIDGRVGGGVDQKTGCIGLDRRGERGLIAHVAFRMP